MRRGDRKRERERERQRGRRRETESERIREIENERERERNDVTEKLQARVRKLESCKRERHSIMIFAYMQVRAIQNSKT